MAKFHPIWTSPPFKTKNLLALASFHLLDNFEKMAHLHHTFSKGDRNYDPGREHSTKQDTVIVKWFKTCKKFLIR